MNEEIGNVTEEVTENVEAQTTEKMEEGIELTDTAETEGKETEPVEEKKEEEPPKGRYLTDEEIDQIVAKKVKRRVAKYEAQKEKELAIYKDTENVLKAGLNATDIADANQKLRDFYEKQGAKMPESYKPGLSSREAEILAKADAQDIIEDGREAMVQEANRLASKKYENLNERERVIFNTLVEELNYQDDSRELLKLGVKEEVLKDDEFNSFRKKFNRSTPISEIYSLYKGKQPKPSVEKIGSMKNGAGKSSVKEFYTYEEASKFSREEIENNPELVKAIEKSMQKW